MMTEWWQKIIPSDSPLANTNSNNANNNIKFSLSTSQESSPPKTFSDTFFSNSKKGKKMSFEEIQNLNREELLDLCNTQHLYISEYEQAIYDLERVGRLDQKIKADLQKDFELKMSALLKELSTTKAKLKKHQKLLSDLQIPPSEMEGVEEGSDVQVEDVSLSGSESEEGLNTSKKPKNGVRGASSTPEVKRKEQLASISLDDCSEERAPIKTEIVKIKEVTKRLEGKLTAFLLNNLTENGTSPSPSPSPSPPSSGAEDLKSFFDQVIQLSQSATKEAEEKVSLLQEETRKARKNHLRMKQEKERELQDLQQRHDELERQLIAEKENNKSLQDKSARLQRKIRQVRVQLKSQEEKLNFICVKKNWSYEARKGFSSSAEEDDDVDRNQPVVDVEVEQRLRELNSNLKLNEDILLHLTASLLSDEAVERQMADKLNKLKKEREEEKLNFLSHIENMQEQVRKLESTLKERERDFHLQLQQLSEEGDKLLLEKKKAYQYNITQLEEILQSHESVQRESEKRYVDLTAHIDILNEMITREKESSTKMKKERDKERKEEKMIREVLENKLASLSSSHRDFMEKFDALSDLITRMRIHFHDQLPSLTPTPSADYGDAEYGDHDVTIRKSPEPVNKTAIEPCNIDGENYAKAKEEYENAKRKYNAFKDQRKGPKKAASFELELTEQRLMGQKGSDVLSGNILLNNFTRQEVSINASNVTSKEGEADKRPKATNSEDTGLPSPFTISFDNTKPHDEDEDQIHI